MTRSGHHRCSLSSRTHITQSKAFRASKRRTQGVDKESRPLCALPSRQLATLRGTYVAESSLRFKDDRLGLDVSHDPFCAHDQFSTYSHISTFLPHINRWKWKMYPRVCCVWIPISNCLFNQLTERNKKMRSVVFSSVFERFDT